jgi:hypothetical protein
LNGGENNTNYNYCNAVCRQFVADIRQENLYLKRLITIIQKDMAVLVQALQADKQFLINILEQRNCVAEEVSNSFDAIMKHKEDVLTSINEELKKNNTLLIKQQNR